ncbi:homocysteine S-methyltransferase [Nocardioides mangrovi]|uniref:Homocysteine S-methyltransferase n=1 Tax=Nocardioides mangrovi TaxID=2874580 RepID=A0ABS7UGZ3_9ACTN|nr:homocysteine S-methyltransferase [Nocardioides mangrovi]MBZ5740299.1 homocysteine S-methyltransferase [Nocardioides mangrovi]
MPALTDGDDVRILDGGLSNALEDRGHDLTSDLWTAELLLEQPGEIAAVHEAYYRAGADVATTASYQASVPGLVAAGLERASAEAVIRSSVAIAIDTRDRLAEELGRPLWVAASVGPYGAYLADGSEYRGRYGVPQSTLRDFHAPRLELLAEQQPDLFAVETVPDADEAEVLVGLLQELGIPAWFSYAVDGDRTRAGQPLADAYAVLRDCPPIIATGVNCSAPEDVAGALAAAHAQTGRPGVAYPNLGEAWDADAHAWAGTPAYDPALAPGWVGEGARLVGGCCRVGPALISDLRATLLP